MSWNGGQISRPQWNGNGAVNKSKYLNVSTLTADEIITNDLYADYGKIDNLSTNNGSIAFLSNLVLNTGVIRLGITPTTLEAVSGVLYVDGQAIAFPSSFSTIADWSQFSAVANVNMSRSSIYNVQSVSTNVISTGTLATNNLVARGLSTVNISSANITFDTLNGRAGTIGTISGSNLVYNDAIFSNVSASNILSRNLFASSIVSSNSIRTLGLSSITISTFLLEANTVAASYGVAAGIVEVSNTLFTKDIQLFDPSYPIWDSNTVYATSNIAQDDFIFYRALTSNRNVIPGSNIPDWSSANSYFINNLAFVGGVGAYRCYSNVAAGASFPPNGDPDHWVGFSGSNDGSQVWSNLGLLTSLRGGITGSIKSYISVGSIVVSNANISTLTSGAITASGNISTTGNITAFGNIRGSGFVSSTSINTGVGLISSLNVNNVSTGDFFAGKLTSFSTLTQHINLYNGPYTQYDINRIYVPGNAVIYNNRNYIAFSSNRGMIPNVNIPNWINGATYQPFNYAFVIGAGSYRCLNTVASSVPPNSDSVNWAVFSPFNLSAQLWTPQGPTVGASIIGDANSFIEVGSISTSILNVSSINVNNISTGTVSLSNITSYNIYNSNALQTTTLDVITDSQLNTLTTSGQVYTQNILNVQGLMSLQSDLYGEVNNVTLLVPPFTTSKQYLKDINDIRTGNFQTVNIVGGSTGNTILPDYFEYSELNIGATETSPAIVNIYGANAELTTALTVYGITSITGDTTINGLATINGLTDLNGDCTVLGFMDVGGTLDVAGITTFTGTVNALGAVTIEGETNVAGLLTAEAGIGIVGATTIQLGDITIGDSGGGPTNNFNLYCYYNNTDIENLTNNGNADFRQNVNIDGTLTANIMNLKSTNTTYANISTLFVSSLIGRSATLHSISTTAISTGIMRADEVLANSMYTNYLSGYNSENIFLFANLDSQGCNISNVNNLTTSNISTTHISTYTLDALTIKGNTLTLQSYNESDPSLVFNRNIDGVMFDEGGLIANPDTGFALASLSSLTVLAYDDINITSGKNVIVHASTFNVPTSASIYGLSTHSISTNFVLADTVFAFKNLVANSTITQDIQLFSDIPNDIRSGITGDNNSYINVGTGTFSTLYGISTLTSSITTNNMFVKGDVPIVGFYKPSDQENPVGAITAADGFGFGIIGTETIQILSSGGDIGITTPSNIVLVADEKVFVGGPELVVSSNANISSIQTFKVSTTSLIAGSATIINDLSANNLFTNSLYTIFLGNPLPYQAPITFNANLNISGNNISNAFLLQSSNISTNFLSTGNLFVDSYAGNSISTNLISSGSLLSGVITTPAISTTTISTSVLNTNSINAPVNINFGKSIIPFSGNNLDIGASGAFRWNNLYVSTVSSINVQTFTVSTLQLNTSSIRANRALIDRINPLTDSGTLTANLYPQSAGSQLGYGSNTAQGGFYNVGTFRSTVTQVIQGSLDNNSFSNVVRIQGTVSTQNIQVSTINRKLYPYTSTFGILNSSSTFTFDGTTSVVPQVLYSNITFPHVGTYLVSGKNTISKSAGGSGQEPYGYFSLSRGLYPSTFNIQDGFNSIPYLNHQNISTFNTFTSEIYVSSMNTNTRFITYADQSGHNYTINFGLGNLRATYIPSQGLNPE